ncbi:MAG: metallophosphoesterase family protein [Gammaproteobacteria bacterium WSBS_2016_MAG_OTU1]
MHIINAKNMLVFGGVYGNAQALHALMETVHWKAAEAIVCTGDVAAYCADGAAVCDLLRQQSHIIIVRGNCERSVGDDEDDCGCGFDKGTTCDLLSVAWHQHAKNTIATNAKIWMRDLPKQQLIQFGGKRLGIVHADAFSDNCFVFASTELDKKLAVMRELQADGIIAGHSGIPFTQNIDGGVWHNSGALGMPANDGTPRVWYSVWTVQEDGILITHYPLQYDIAAAQEAMKHAALPDEYRLSLQSGIWPSDSVLPQQERKQQGESLTLVPYLW